MENIPALLNALQSMSAEQPVGFALGVILVMVVEGLMLVVIISMILRIFFKPESRGKRSR